MNSIYKKLSYLVMAGVVLAFSGCDDLSEIEETPNAPYVLSLGITSSGTTTYYVVTTDDLMNGTIDAKGKGIEQSGYRDYTIANNTIFSIGGLGVNYVTGMTRNAAGYLQETDNFIFDSKLSAFAQADNNTMIGMEIPDKAASGNQIKFYTVDINSVSITKTTTVPIAPISELEWPSITGMEISGGKVYVSYIQMNPNTYATSYVDTGFVAVYSYPELAFEKVMQDTRTGAVGSWAASNGFIKVENGDLYTMSNLSMANGFSNGGTKHAGFLRIPAGTTGFDSSYFFDFEAGSGGLKPAHAVYLGNGLVFAEVSTLNPQTSADRWSDKDLKCSIVDLYNQTITDVEGIPVHNGSGGRRFAVLVDGGYVYLPVSTDDGIYIYRTDISTGVAERGAKVSASFVPGIFKLN
ncbi:DUF4374 domain-containing protein [Dysgonomonas macrotermitis]|uniref:DUF4374 domain-containing protein n=1 Tax=Dysgonomonas macrotermitis TaxID=1346286 RepID=A0A1M5FKR3_9BACT|nr:DUF4374 domain-containing protein [Dysgonomonas macrotermitis]SHF92098.1 protein of unknown function [Dysgonomonas macrotermitis]